MVAAQVEPAVNSLVAHLVQAARVVSPADRQLVVNQAEANLVANHPEAKLADNLAVSSADSPMETREEVSLLSNLEVLVAEAVAAAAVSNCNSSLLDLRALQVLRDRASRTPRPWHLLQLLLGK